MDKINKAMTAEEAVSSFVRDGDLIAIGGFVTNRRPYGLIREVIRQRRRDLYVESGASGGDVDMLIGAGCVKAIICSYIANSGFTQVCRRFRAAIESNAILFDDLSLDVQTIAYHGAALGLSYVPIKNMIGSDLVSKWGISAEERVKHDKLPNQKLILMEDPFDPGTTVCCVPTPKIDVAFLHVQKAAKDGTFQIHGPGFQDLDIAMAAKRTIISCEEIVDTEELRRHSAENTCTGLCVDAVVHQRHGAHPSQCFGYYDYDPKFLRMYDVASRTQEQFDVFLEEYVYCCATQEEYLEKFTAEQLISLTVDPVLGYKPGLKR